MKIKKAIKAIRIITVALLLSIILFSIISCESEPDTTGTGIIIGEDGWLFEEKSGNGSELGDYTGETLFTEDELEQILGTVKAKRTFFAKTNTDFIIIIVPNKMNVYSDKLPAELKAKRSTETRIKQVYDYIKKNTRISMVDLSELFSMNAAAFDLYERTDSMLSDMGAYLAYTEIVKAVNALNIAELKLADLDSFKVDIADDDGKKLAERVGAASRYKNKTISLTYKYDLPYVTDKYDIDNLDVTVINEDQRDKNYRYTNLMIYGTENLETIKKFASLTFKCIGYTKGFITDAEATTTLKPNQAVFLIGEKELDELLENKTLNEELLSRPEDNIPEPSVDVDPDPVPTSLELSAPDENTCAKPIITGKSFAGPNRLVIAGVSENGTTIHAAGGLYEEEYYVYDGIFLLDIECDPNIKKVDIFASADGKNNSETATVTVTSSMSRDNKDVIIGKDGHLHIGATMYDYLGTNAYSAGALSNMRSKLEKKLDKIHEVSPDTKLIVIIAPNHSTIYPETMPDWLQEQRQEGATSKLQQLYSKMQGSEVIFPNLTELLLSKKSEDALLYQKTDTHWNELGAYYAYEYLMNEYIAPDFPEAAAIPLSEFEIFTRSVPGGDMLNFLGFNLDLTREISVFVRPKTFTPVTGYDKPFRMNFENIWTSETHVFKKENDKLPTMLMYRDSFSTNLINFLAENFSESYFTNMWEYRLDYNYIKNNKPDYVIIESVERNIDSIG